MSSVLAKITRPRADGIAPRERVFHLLDGSRTRSVVWVAAPAGAGKTALLASYTENRHLPCLWYQLDPTDGDPVSFFDYLGRAVQGVCSRKISLPPLLPEHFPAITIFARRFFAALADAMPQPSLIVFDDYHDLPAASPIHDIFRHGLTAFSPSLNAFILSRSAPPPPLIRMLSTGAMVRIPADGLRLTLEESFSLAALRGLDREADADRIHKLHHQTEGWAAGFVLSMIHDGEAGRAPVLSQEALFDYFAGEILDQLDMSVRDFLEKTAIFPEFTIDMAHQLTNHPEARRILSEMIRNNHFTTIHGDDRSVYRYHALFRNCLLTRAQMTFGENDLQALRLAAANILQEEGAFNDAFSVLTDAHLWEEAALLVRTHAEDLAKDGLFSTLADWIGRLPARLLKADPWLLFWFGTALLPLQGPKAARVWFEKAYENFRPGNDPAGIYLSWCGVVECYLFEWNVLKRLDPWLDELQKIRDRFPVYPHPEIEARVVIAIFSALCFRRPWANEMGYWTREAEKILRTSANISIRLLMVRQLVIGLLWKGEFRKVEYLLGEFGRSGAGQGGPFLENIYFRSTLAFAYWLTGRPREAMAIFAEDIKEAERNGLPAVYHLLLSVGIYLHSDRGEIELAQKYIDRMETLLSDRVMEVAFFQYMKALEKAHRQDPLASLRHADISLRKAFRAGSPLHVTLNLLTKGQILLGMGQYRQSARVLHWAQRLAHWVDSAWCLARYELTAAELCFAQQEFEQGMEHLRQGFALCREKRILHFDWWRPRTMAELCARALEAGIETEFVQEMILTNDLVAVAPHLDCEEWPWPLRVYSLGRFELVVDGKRLVSPGKIQKKPLELFKALISLGGEDVHESQVADCLWPDAEGDLGRNSFNVTLGRLRRLLGHDQALIFQGGRLSLNRPYCWVDGFALERLMEEGEQFWKRIDRGQKAGPDDLPRAVWLTEKAISLYQGHFLPGNADRPWTASTRERLRRKFIRGVEMLGRHWEKAGAQEKAIDCYLAGLEKDELVEEFYQRLMLCYHRLGHQAKGVETYRRCRLSLAAGLGLKPSAETEAIYAMLLG